MMKYSGTKSDLMTHFFILWSLPFSSVFALNISQKARKMEHLLEENVALEDLKKFEARYQTELAGGQVSSSAQFDYAWCLVRSKYPSDIRKGILLLEDLYTVSLLRKHVFLVISVLLSSSRVLNPGGRVF